MGFIADTIVEIRDATDEPATDAKYADSRLYRLISQAFGRVWTDLNQVSRHKTVVRFDLDVVANQNVYALPPTAKRIVDIQYIDNAGNIFDRFEPSSHVNPIWPGVVLEGSNLIFQHGYEPTSAFTLRLLYHPTGFVSLAYGDVTTITQDTANYECAIVLDATPTGGTLELRPNAYAGCILRLLTARGEGAGLVQDRIIKSWAPKTRLAEVAPHYETGVVPETVVSGIATAGVWADPITPVTATTAIFTADMVGKSLQWATSSNEYVIATYTSPTIVNVTGNASAEAAGDAISVLTLATYEITPLLADELVTPVALHVARYIVGIDGDAKRYQLLDVEYQRALRDVRQNTAHHEVVRGMVMNVVTVRSPNTIRSSLGRRDGGAAFIG